MAPIARLRDGREPQPRILYAQEEGRAPLFLGWLGILCVTRSAEATNQARWMTIMIFNGLKREVFLTALALVCASALAAAGEGATVDPYPPLGRADPAVDRQGLTPPLAVHLRGPGVVFLMVVTHPKIGVVIDRLIHPGFVFVPMPPEDGCELTLVGTDVIGVPVRPGMIIELLLPAVVPASAAKTSAPMVRGGSGVSPDPALSRLSSGGGVGPVPPGVHWAAGGGGVTPTPKSAVRVRGGVNPDPPLASASSGGMDPFPPAGRADPACDQIKPVPPLDVHVSGPSATVQLVLTHPKSGVVPSGLSSPPVGGRDIVRGGSGGSPDPPLASNSPGGVGVNPTPPGKSWAASSGGGVAQWPTSALVSREHRAGTVTSSDAHAFGGVVPVPPKKAPISLD